MSSYDLEQQCRRDIKKSLLLIILSINIFICHPVQADETSASPDYLFLKDYIESLRPTVEWDPCLIKVDPSVPPVLDSPAKALGLQNCYQQGMEDLKNSEELISKYTESADSIVKDVAERTLNAFHILGQDFQNLYDVYEKIYDAWMHPSVKTDMNPIQTELAEETHSQTTTLIQIYTACSLMRDLKQPSSDEKKFSLTNKEIADIQQRLKDVFGTEVLTDSNSIGWGPLGCGKLIYRRSGELISK